MKKMLIDMKNVLITTLMLIVILCSLISILPPGIFYVSIFTLLMVCGICGIYYDNCPRKLEDGKEYCSPNFNPNGKGIDKLK